MDMPGLRIGGYDAMRVNSIDDLPPALRKQAIEQMTKQQAIKAAQIERGRSGANTKFHNSPMVHCGIKFDSKKEARRYDELMVLLTFGEIRNLRLQCDITIFEAYTKPDGQRVRAMRYRADFTYERQAPEDGTGEARWEKVVEDVKSRPTRTKDYLIKKKALQNLFGITIEEV